MRNEGQFGGSEIKGAFGFTFWKGENKEEVDKGGEISREIERERVFFRKVRSHFV